MRPLAAINLRTHNGVFTSQLPCLLAQHIKDLPERDQARVHKFLDCVSKAWGVSFQPGYNPGVTYMSWLWEPLR